MPVRVRSQTGCVAIRAKAPVWRVSTNPSLKAGVSDGLIPVFTRTSLNWALVLVKTGISPDSACTEPVEAPDLQSIGQQTCSDYLLSIPYREKRLLCFKESIFFSRSSILLTPMGVNSILYKTINEFLGDQRTFNSSAAQQVFGVCGIKIGFSKHIE